MSYSGPPYSLLLSAFPSTFVGCGTQCDIVGNEYMGFPGSNPCSCHEGDLGQAHPLSLTYLIWLLS